MKPTPEELRQALTEAARLRDAARRAEVAAGGGEGESLGLA